MRPTLRERFKRGVRTGAQVAETYFEDLEVGRTISIGEWLVSKAQCVAFADTWEPQPHHTSEVAAASSIHGRLTVCSLYLFAICTRLFFDYEKPLAVVAMLGKDNVSLPNPAYPGERLLYETRCIDSRVSKSRSDTGIVTLSDRLSTVGGRVVLRQDVKLLLSRKAM